MQVQAAVSRGPAEPFAIEDVELSALRDDELLVRIVAAGLCHTDLATKAMLPAGLPAILGHEGAGIVEQVGAAVKGVAVGDHVVLSYRSCGKCCRCEAGATAYCEQFAALNSSGGRPDGSPTVTRGETPVWSSFFGQSSFATHVIASERNTVVVSSELDLPLLAPFGCGFQTGAGAVVNVLRPGPADSLAVYGAGGVGIAAVMAAKALGVDTIVAVELSDKRRQLALEVGATHAVDGAASDIVEQVRRITKGGAAKAIDTTAVPGVMRNAISALAPLGTIVVVGIGRSEVELNIADLIASGKTVRGCIEGDGDPQRLVPLMIHWMRAGKFPVEKVISHYPFEKINDAVADANGDAVKAVLLV